MFDIGWQEIFLIGLVALIVIGPKDLPRALKSIMQMIKKMKGMARDFQGGLDDIVRESDLQDIRKQLEDETGGDFRRQIEDAIDPTGEVKKDLDELATVESDLNSAARGFQADMESAAADAPAGQTSAAVSPPAENTIRPPSGQATVKSES